VIAAPHFAASRMKANGNTGVFVNTQMPFYEPNLLLVSHDQKTEIYVYHNKGGRYTMILGGRSEEKDLSFLLNSIANALRDMNVSYMECLIDAYSPELQQQALDARFIPCAYMPALRLVEDKRWDYIVFSRSFDMLDFRNVTMLPAYREYLKEYLTIWHKLYIEAALTEKK